MQPTGLRFASAHNAALDVPPNSVGFGDEGREQAQAFRQGLDEALQIHRTVDQVTSSQPLQKLLPRFSDSQISAAGESWPEYLEFLRKEILPHVVDVNHPRCIGHMTSQLPPLFAEISRLLPLLNQNVVKVETSKVLTLIERQTLAQMHRLFFGRSELYYQRVLGEAGPPTGIVTSGGSLSNITALWIARNRVLEMDDSMGLPEALHAQGARSAAVLVSGLGHYSLKKAASVLGIGQRNLIRVPVNSDGSMDVDAARRIAGECEREQRRVFAIVGIAGSTETGVIDDLRAIAELAGERGFHFHADAAWGGPLAFSKTHRPRLDGIELADTISVCGHKQLYLPQGISTLLVREPAMLNSIKTLASYQARAGSFDLGAYSMEGSRTPMALLLHAALSLLGSGGYETLVDDSVDRARTFAQLIESDPAFELFEPPSTNIVVFRYLDPGSRGCSAEECQRRRPLIDRINTALQQEQFDGGNSLISRTTLSHGRAASEAMVVLRAALCNPDSDEAVLRAVLNEQRQRGDIISAAVDAETVRSQC